MRRCLFHGKSVVEARQALQEAVRFYLATCAARGEQPDRPLSGRIVARVPPELHARAISTAKTLGKSLNQFINDAIGQAVKH
ncbi:MAG: type II toxin-antitoxin system HicB family antitoxin [Magnetococcales bacterium]|nr:type II toxin-antitoxin system HicB family antitoxin [Magnetococcales bacterium]